MLRVLVDLNDICQWPCSCRFLVKKRELKNSELIKSETKIIKSRLLAYLLIKASSEVSFLNSPSSIINYNLHRPFLFYAFGL